LIERYRLALGLLERHDPQGFAVFAGSVSAIAPLQLDPPLEAGKCVSLSIGGAPGVVLLTMIPIILLSETLLHEAAHCRLSAAEDLAPLWSSSGVRVESPLRPDPRPIAGLYHQTYVLFWLSRYFRRLRGATQESVVQRNQRQIDKRIDELTTGFRDAIATLRANRRELTPLGERLVEEMASGDVP
jgi:HEXXH motif-containing protein